VVTLCLSAIMVATQVATEPGTPQDEAADSLHPDLMLWTFRGTLAFFLGWTLWATVAWRLRHRYVQRPKGLRALFGSEAGGGDGRLRRWLRLLGYGRKAPDAELDLRLPSQSFPSRRRDG